MTRFERAYGRALEAAIATPSEVASGMGKAYRTFHAYRDGSRRITEDAGWRLVRYLRQRADRMLAAADALETTLTKEENDET